MKKYTYTEKKTRVLVSEQAFQNLENQTRMLWRYALT